MSWPAGTLLVCINDNWTNPSPFAVYLPKKGDLCTSDGPGSRCPCGCGAEFVRLKEGPGCDYQADHFQKIEGAPSEAYRLSVKQPAEIAKVMLASIAMGIALLILTAYECQGADIPDWVLRGIASVETSSSWRDLGDITYTDRRKGDAGEVGPWQLSPAVLRDLKAYDKRERVHSNVVLAESLTREWLLRCYRTTGDWFQAVVIYHVGPNGDRRRGHAYAERVRVAGTITN